MAPVSGASVMGLIHVAFYSFRHVTALLCCEQEWSKLRSPMMSSDNVTSSTTTTHVDSTDFREL